MSEEERIKAAVGIALDYGGIDGSHHKMWVIDQMLRHLLGEDYAKTIQEAEADDFEWDTGIAP